MGEQDTAPLYFSLHGGLSYSVEVYNYTIPVKVLAAARNSNIHGAKPLIIID